MSDNIFNRVGKDDLSESAIEGIINDEIKAHRKEETHLPIMKLKLPAMQQTVRIHKPAPKAEEQAPAAGGPPSRIGMAKDLLSVPAVNLIKLPDSLTETQKLKKRFRMRRYGMPIVDSRKKLKPVTAIPSVKAADKGRHKALKAKKALIGVEMLLPAVILFLIFSWFPIIKTFVMSFMNFVNLNKVIYNGTENFVKLFADSQFWSALGHSAYLSLIVIVVGAWLPFFLAIYIHEMRKGSSLMKVLYFIPFLTPAVPAAILWKWMYNQGFGLINGVLSIFAGQQVSVGWLTDPALVIPSIAVVFIWKNTGWAMLIYLAALQNVPKVLFEEASMHGATVWQKIRNIIIPSVIPIMLAVVFIQIINSMQVFTEVYIMTNGGPEGSSEVIATYIYKKAFLFMDIGYASAMAVAFLFILITITLARMGTSRRRS